MSLEPEHPEKTFPSLLSSLFKLQPEAIVSTGERRSFSSCFLLLLLLQFNVNLLVSLKN